jgi:GNAT superfamily N-acetyltransferase
MAHTLEFLTDPAAFLAAAGDHLALDPVQGTVVVGVAERSVRGRADGVVHDHPEWYAVARDEAGRVVGTAMRTAPFRPYPLFVLSMPDEVAVALARAVHARGEVAPANGALPAARVFTDEMARLTGHRVEVAVHTRLFELGDLVPPAYTPPGRLRLATGADLPTAIAWFDDFSRAADEQSGRTTGHAEAVAAEDVLRRITERRLWFWDDAGPVHLTSASLPGFGVSRIGPVYTPDEQRSKGYASAAVAEVSRLVRDEGARVCLFTDQANPVSNAIYTRLGYRPVVDMANHRLVWRAVDSVLR